MMAAIKDEEFDMCRVRLPLLLVLVSLLPATNGWAVEWPQRPLRLIVPFSAGSSSDTIARIVAAKMGERLGQQIAVENRVGGSTIIGTEAIARSSPDGYTLGLANTTTLAVTVALTSKLPFDPLGDFKPIGMIGSSPFVLVSSPLLPASNLKEFIDLAKAKPGALSYASAGTGTLAHLAGELLKLRTNINVVHIPYRGTSQSTLDLIQGRIDLSVSTIAPTLQYIHEGTIRALAVTSEHRNSMLPDVPTVAQAGASGCEAALWTAIVAPAGVSDYIVNRLNQVLIAVVDDPQIQQALKIQGVDPEAGTPETVSAAIGAGILKWRDVVKAIGISEPN
jgi:tripartite-type tricarboxylate transporter receptor subunit TctC